ncbi:MAG: GLPGLI family protein [Bacteroidales bacterium]|nr:GLPGLI family protein [Bacteroidales bacterium]
MRILFIGVMLFIISLTPIVAQEYTLIDTVRQILYYDYNFNETAGECESIRRQQMQLEIGDKYSLFLSIRNAYTDSLLVSYQHLPPKEAFGKIWPMIMGMDSHIYARHTVLKKYPNRNKISVFAHFSTPYQSVEDVNFNWQIHANRDTTIIELRCLMATTTYGGRDYVAWFASDIPISDGPYKFCGLPGIIVRIADTENEHVFELQGAKYDINKPMYIVQGARQKITTKEFVRAFYDNNASIAKRFEESVIETSDPNAVARIERQTKRRNNYIERY